jgi:hypothetical protein
VGTTGLSVRFVVHMYCIERKGIINIWFVFDILEIVENFIRITYSLYVDLI